MGLFSSKQENPGKRERELAEDKRRRDADAKFYEWSKAKRAARLASKSK